MEQILSAWRLKIPCASFVILSLLSTVPTPESAYALTASIGQPYRGHLVNGVPFPHQFRGYQVRDETYSYATPELVGAVLDSIEKVLAKYPDSCDVFVGDMSGPQGGRLRHHRSHENGRDIDLGLYAKGNRPLGGFSAMNEENLDVPKTWELIENLLRSRLVQYIFVDNGIQRPLYRYALSQGIDQSYLDRLFGCAGNQDAHTVIQHLRGHRDHMHVRFYTPWSTLAGQLNALTEKQRGIIDLAQGAYLPKKVNYYVQGNEAGIGQLAASFGVATRDLCRWNQLRGNEVLDPGSCLVFYKRGFEVEPVRLAQSLQPNGGGEAPLAVGPRSVSAAPVKLAALQTEQNDAMVDVPTSLANPPRDERRTSAKPKVMTHTVRKGETLASIAKKNKMDVDTLCRLNGMKKHARLSRGQKLKVSEAESRHSTEAAPPASSKQQERSSARRVSTKQEQKAAGKAHQKTLKATAKATVGKQQNKSKAKGAQTVQTKNTAAKPGKTVAATKSDKKAAVNSPNKKTADAKKPVASKQPEKSKAAVARTPGPPAKPEKKAAAKPEKKAAAKPEKKSTAVNNGKKAPTTAAASTSAKPKNKKPI
jgi:LysM repeat protein